MNLALLKTQKIWRIYNGNGTPQGYFLENEKSLAEAEAKRIGGYILPDKIYYFG